MAELSDVILAGRQIADVEKSNLYDAPTLLRMGQESVRYLYDVLVSRFPEQYFVTHATITLASGALIDLTAAVVSGAPTDLKVYKELGLTRINDGQPQTIYPLPNYQARNDCSERRYWLAGSELTFWPQTGGWNHTGTYTLDFVAECPDLATDDPLPREMNRWTELLGVLMAIKLKEKRDQPHAELDARLATLEAKLSVVASNRKAEPKSFRIDRTHDQLPFCTNPHRRPY